ncbi:MAG: sulfatase-like hydrolase/transferase [Pseudomonadota bacterium]
MARNLLILCSDEHRADALGCAGHRAVKSPVLDRLASRGVRFSNAYTPSPMCVPARAALATGLPIHQTGHWDSATPYAGAPESWMQALRASGVDVVSFGKLHYRAGQDHGFADEVLPMHVAGDGWTLGLLRQNAPEFDATRELAHDSGEGWSDYARYDARVTEAACDWLNDPERAAVPWAAFVSLVSPHYPLMAPPEYMRLYDPDTLDGPTGRKPTHPELQRYDAFWDYDRHFDEDSARIARAAYFGLVSYLDACVGRVLAALDASGQAGDTLILYISDHGEMLGDHGFWTKQVMYEASARVPMILAGPDWAEGTLCHTAVSLTDVAPTVLTWAGLKADHLPGTPLQELARRPYDPARTVFSEYHDGGSTTGAFMVRWANWKYVHYHGERAQFFDLARDPDEDCDLAAEPEAATVLAEGERRLHAICDPAVVTARAFADQARRVAELGGVTRLRDGEAFNHTPVPT